MTSAAEYRIGRFTLRPRRQILDDRGVAVSIGRRALDLLSVLAEAEGALVTKDELMAAVWPNAVVEENAIQVHVAALRKLLGKDAELLTTLRGLGYRLDATPGSPSVTRPLAGQEPTVAAASQRGIAAIISAGVSIAAIAAALLLPIRDRLPWTSQPAGPKVAVLPFDTSGSSADVHGFADSLLDKIVGVLSDNKMQPLSRPESQALRGPGARQEIERLGADLLLDGQVRGDGKNIDISLHLDDVRDGVTVWSGEFRGQANAPDALRADAAAHAADATHWASLARSGSVRLNAAGLSAFIAGRDSTTGVRHDSDAAALANYQSVVATAPDFSWGHSAIAATDAFELIGEAEPSQRAVLRANAQREAARALTLDARNGEAYVALGLAAPPHDWQSRESLLTRGTAADPSFEPGALMEGRLLWAVGRAHSALPWFERAHSLDPLHNGGNFSLAVILAAEGREADSKAMVAQMQLEWPEHPATKWARFWTSVLLGDRTGTLAQLADLSARPPGLDQIATDAWREGITAAGSKDPGARAHAIVAVRDAADDGSLDHGQALTLLAMLGDLDGAFAQARLYEPGDPITPPYLFLPTTAAMRADPRFLPLARRLGFADYWYVTNAWPDFCRGGAKALPTCAVARHGPP